MTVAFVCSHSLHVVLVHLVTFDQLLMSERSPIIPKMRLCHLTICMYVLIIYMHASNEKMNSIRLANPMTHVRFFTK